MPFSASAGFCFTSSTTAKGFHLRTFFIRGNKKKCHSGWDWVNREAGQGCHAILGQKLLNIQHGVGRCARKSPIMKWANVLKESSKKFTDVEHSLSQQHQLVHWYKWVPRTLTWGGGSLYLSWMYVCDIIFPISQPGNCSASCLLSSPAPRNRQESNTVTMLLTQLLLNAGSLKVEHQHSLILYSHSDNLREI